MLTNKSFLRGLWILGAAWLLAGYEVTIAQTRYNLDRGTTRDTATVLRENAPVDGGNLPLRRATRLIGKPLKSTQGATLGKINDLVLTPNLNQVSYAVLVRGGLFGLGERRYAIPWSAMRAGVGDTIVAPIDKQELQQDRGFHKNLWPSEGDPRWLGRAGERTEQVTFDVQPATEKKEIRRRRASYILGMAARGPDNGRVGAVRDMLIAMDTGDVPFTIVSYGGLLGLGRKYTAVPANAIEFHPRDYTARIAVDEQILRANAFHPGDFPDLADPIYAQRIYSAYNVNPEDPDWVVLGYVPPEIPGRPQPQTPLSARPQTTFQTRPQTRITTQQQPTQQRTQGQTPIPGLQVPQTPAPSPLQNEYLAIFAADNLRTIEGVVTGVSTFQQVGTNAEWVQLQVRADDGSLVTIHLGPRAYVSRQDFYVASNDRITLTGAQATAWRQPIILPITATVGNETITLRDPSGRPLWLEPANGGNAQQNNQQTSQQSDVQNNQQNTPPAQQ